MELTTDDYIAIQQLYARYAFAVNFHDMDAWLAMWTEDGELVGRTKGISKGKVELRQRLAEAFERPDLQGYYHYTNLAIEATPYGASGKCYFTHVFVSDAIGEVHQALFLTDELVKEDGRWLFRRRDLAAKPE